MKRNIYIFFILILFTFSTAYSQWNLLNLGGGSTGPIISTKPGTFFVATGLGIYRSTNSTLSWQNVSDNGIGSFWRSYPYAMAGRGDTVIFGTYGHVIGGAHIFITTDNGTNWRLISTGVRVSSFIFKDNCLIYTASVEGQGDGIYRSTDVGQTWTLVSNQSIRNFMLYGNNIYGTSNYGFYRTSDYGTSWELISAKSMIISLTMGNLFLGTGYRAFYRSTDYGYTWDTSTSPFFNSPSIVSINGIIIASDDWDFSSYRSLDTGRTWTKANTLGSEISSYCVSGNNIYGAYSGVLRSTDKGITWTRRNTGLTDLSVYRIFADGRFIYASTSKGLGVSRNNGSTWSDAYAFNSFNVGTNNGFAKAGSDVFFAADTVVYRTSNNGLSWLRVYGSAVRNSAVAIGSIGTNVYLYYNTVGMLHTTNRGINWFSISSPPGNIYKIIGAGNLVLAGGDTGIYSSSDNGTSWLKLNTSYFSAAVKDIETLNSYWFAATDTGVFRSADNGASWIYTSYGLPQSFFYPYDIQTAGNNLYYSNYTHIIYVSTDFGINWGMLNDEVVTDVYCLAANNSYVFCGTSAQECWSCLGHTSGVYRHDYGIILDLKQNQEKANSFQLSQNYPNPFNPTTKIKFNIPNMTSPLTKGGLGGSISLKIYDILGREVATLINEKLKPGAYEVEWDGSNFASGVYFYKLISGNYTDTRKMILMK